jgi:polysaccharide pyruvyl transferase WcaK-like protein
MGEGRPAVALAYQPKATATYELLNLSELCLDVQSFTVKELSYKLELILSRLDEYEQKVAAAVTWARTVIEETYLNGSYPRLSMSGTTA